MKDRGERHFLLDTFLVEFLLTNVTANIFTSLSSTDRPLIQTLYYMAPEMLLGKTCDPAVDMWSLGCMLAELYLGRCLFLGRDIVHQFSCIMKVVIFSTNNAIFITFKLLLNLLPRGSFL